jgi:hypothetical protein
MWPYAAPMSSAAWMFAHAARRTDTTTTTISFGDQVTLLVPPRTQPTQVLRMPAGGGTTFPDAAISALTTA